MRSLGVICYKRRVLSEGHKNYLKDWCLMNSQPLFLTYLTQCVMVISKGRKPDNFESLNSLKPNFTIFETFVRTLLIVNLSMNQILLTFLLYVRQTRLTQLILAISL